LARIANASVDPIDVTLTRDAVHASSVAISFSDVANAAGPFRAVSLGIVAALTIADTIETLRPTARNQGPGGFGQCNPAVSSAP
jgi:hypothetical protein